MLHICHISPSMFFLVGIVPLCNGCQIFSCLHSSLSFLHCDGYNGVLCSICSSITHVELWIFHILYCKCGQKNPLFLLFLTDDQMYICQILTPKPTLLFPLSQRWQTWRSEIEIESFFCAAICSGMLLFPHLSSL